MQDGKVTIIDKQIVHCCAELVEAVQLSTTLTAYATLPPDGAPGPEEVAGGTRREIRALLASDAKQDRSQGSAGISPKFPLRGAR